MATDTDPASKIPSSSKRGYLPLTCFGAKKDGKGIEGTGDGETAFGGKEKGLSKKEVEALLKKQLTDFKKSIAIDMEVKEPYSRPMCVPSVSNWISFITTGLTIIGIGVTAIIVVYSIYFFAFDRFDKFNDKLEKYDDKFEKFENNTNTKFKEMELMIGNLTETFKAYFGQRGKH
ncbi:hypothetical protein ACQ4LE_004353 [Meloidogyne hapla]|uniref:Col_cuticle_N domain-containing protein n=1 Tax=Meloidogyne hapla TaxID=6305 RepID=A0A1I8BBH6_MELHA